MRRPRLYLWTAGLNADLSVVTAVEGTGERDPPWATSFGSEARWVPCWDCCTASTFIGSRLRVLWPSVRQAAKQKASTMAFGPSSFGLSLGHTFSLSGSLDQSPIGLL